MSLVKWRTGKNLTDKLKIADMAKDHKKVDWNLIETRWDVPGQMANLTKMANPAETEKTCQEGEKPPKDWCNLKWGCKRFFGKIANLLKYAKTWPKGWKWEICPTKLPNWRRFNRMPERWQSGQNGEHLTGKVKMTEKAKNHKTFDGYLIENRWDALVKWRIWQKKNLTGKVKIAYMAKDQKKVDGNLIEDWCDVPGQMANLA